VEPDLEPRAGVQPILDGRSQNLSDGGAETNQSLKFGFRFYSPSLWGKRVVQKIQWFSVYNGMNHS